MLLNLVPTFALAVPLHRRLTLAREPATLRRLINVNWLRTTVWSAHGIVAVALLSH